MVRACRAACLGTLLTVASVAPAATDGVLVEDWSTAAVGTRGVPPGWQKQNWGSPRYDFTVQSEGPGRFLHLRSEDDSSTISKEMTVDVKQWPVLQWRWKVVALPKGGDARRKEADDEAVQIYVTFPRFPSAVRSRIIGYIWDSTAPVGSIFASQKVGTVTFVVVRSGEADLGRWLTETRMSTMTTSGSTAGSPGRRSAPWRSRSTPRTPALAPSPTSARSSSASPERRSVVAAGVRLRGQAFAPMPAYWVSYSSW